ncbi:uncharacterized protein B0H64DRAFT_161238 [Chaetomium fimeti]|uniref:Secreted protein n=1 Tax=Chaetomium fimeti TaxID=1854472 RepID=A0AAE0HG84_9PEZI|nr:hypothetical protein B0H64DRAFT_161238 [Chaetomium fimeti]
MLFRCLLGLGMYSVFRGQRCLTLAAGKTNTSPRLVPTWCLGRGPGVLTPIRNWDKCPRRRQVPSTPSRQHPHRQMRDLGCHQLAIDTAGVLRPRRDSPKPHRMDLWGCCCIVDSATAHYGCSEDLPQRGATGQQTLTL